MLILKSSQERWDPRWAALLVVDVQNDFASPKGSAAQRGEDVSASLAMVPRLLAGEKVSRADIVAMGHGGLQRKHDH